MKLFTKNKKSVHFGTRTNMTVNKIIMIYSNELLNLYDYYSLAINKRIISKFRYYHYYSLLKTIAIKEKISVKTVMNKYREELKFYNNIT
jgi:hypothetical protein